MEVALTGLADEPNLGVKGKTGAKGGSVVWGLSNWVNISSIQRKGVTTGEGADLRQKSRDLVWIQHFEILGYFQLIFNIPA